jgi:hypothetical protein
VVKSEIISIVNNTNEDNHGSAQPISNIIPKSAVIDSGSQNHYLPVADAGPERTWGKLDLGANAVSASNTPMVVLGTKQVKIPGIEPVQAKILQDLQDPLISVPRLCSQGYKVIFSKHDVQIRSENDKIVAAGHRDAGVAGLYKIPITHQPKYQIPMTRNRILDTETTYRNEVVYYMPNLSTYYGGVSFRSKAERVSFYHAAMGYPTVACLVAAMKSHLHLPGITAADVIANPPKTEATAKGHLRQHIKGVQSTKTANQAAYTQVSEGGDVQDSEGASAVESAIHDDEASGVPESDQIGQNSGKTLGATEAVEKTLLNRDEIPGIEAEDQHTMAGNAMISFIAGKLSADTTGKFQVNSVMGHSAVHVSYIQSANYIRLNPIKNRTEVNDVLVRVYEDAIKLGHKINLVLTDNEISNAAKSYFAKLKVEQRQVEPYNHRANDAERHIQTVKRHVIATLAGRDSECPLENWDKAVEMAELTLSLLRKGTSEGHSSFQSYHGRPYNFNDNPIAPWGVKVQAYVPKALRKSWGYRAKTSFYMGPANYRQHQLREIGAKVPSVRQQVVFLSEDIKYPRFTERDELVARITDLADALKRQGSPPDTTLAQALEAYAAAFPKEDEEYPLMEADVIEDGNHVVWISSPSDFGEGNADSFEAVTHYNADNYAKAPPAVSNADTQESNTDSQPEVDTPDPDMQKENSETEHQASTPAPEHAERLPVGPTRHVPTGAYATRAAKKILDPMAEELDPETILVLTENDHKKYSMRQAMRTPNAEDWRRADVAEFLRFLSIDGVELVHPDDTVRRDAAPRNVIKVLENKVGKPRRVRAAYNGSKRRDEVRQEQYSNFSSDHLAKKIFCAALATRSKTVGARMATIDLESFYLHERNKLPRTDYMYYDATFFPKDMRTKFDAYIRDNRILLSCTQAIYGMYDAGTIAGTVLSTTLTENGYVEVDATNLWTSTVKGEEDLLINTNVDDFAIIHVPASRALARLERVLNDAGYKFVQAESNPKLRFQNHHFCGLDIEHDTQEHIVTLYLNGWVRKLLEKYGMENCKPETAPYKYIRPVYTGKQAPLSEDDSKPLSSQLITELQSKIGALNWGAACVNYDTSLAVSKVGSKQAQPTKALLREVNHILGYLAGHPNTVLQYHPSDMKLHTVSDASFCSETKGRSRAGGVLYLGDCDENGHPKSSPVEVMSHIIDCIPDSAAEAEYVSVHDTTKRGVYCRYILEGIGYPQGTTEHECDNKCAVGIANNTVHDRKTKHIDRRYHWVKNEVKTGRFKVIWKEGVGNIADFFTKYLPQKEHEKYANIFTKQYTPSREGVLGTESLPQRAGV